MKKFAMLLMALCLLLCACESDNEAKVENTAPAEATVTEAAVEATAEATPAATEEPAAEAHVSAEFVLCQEWKNVMSGESYVFSDDGSCAYEGTEGKYEYDAENNAVKCDLGWGVETYEVFEEDGIFKLRFMEYVYVPANVYAEYHERAILDAQAELLQDNTYVAMGEANMLPCGLSYTLDSVDVNEADNAFTLNFTCKNNTDEYCADFDNIKVTWASGKLGCMFDVAVEESGSVGANETAALRLTVKAQNRTLAELRQDGVDTFGFLCIEFKTPKTKAYISVDTLLGAE